MKKSILLFLLIFSIIFLSPTNAVLVTPKYGVLFARDGQTISYNFTFPNVPVVLTSAQVNGKAISSCAVDVEKDKFKISLRDDAGNPVPSAWVQWIAFLQDPSLKMVGGIIIASHGQHISFNLPDYPVIVTNAQIGGNALISGAMNNSPTGFDLCLVDSNGNPVKNAWLLWGAIVPDYNLNGFKGEVKLLSNGANISFSPPFSQSPAYVLSAQPGVIAGAVNNRNDGFLLSLIKHDGTFAQNVWVQWLGFAGLTTSTQTTTPQLSYTETGSGYGPDISLGRYAYTIDNGYLKAWVYAYAELPKSDVTSYLRVINYKQIKINAPDNNFYNADLSITVDVKGLIAKIDYSLPVGASDTQYLGKVGVGIVESTDAFRFQNYPGYSAIVWQKASRDWIEFLQSQIYTIYGAVGGYFVPGYDTVVTLLQVANQSVQAAECVNGIYKVDFRNIRLKGNTTYSIYVYIEGKARAVCLGVAESVCEVDFYHHTPYIAETENNDPLGGRGVKILNYNITFKP
jgi:hypothetical protein